MNSLNIEKYIIKSEEIKDALLFAQNSIGSYLSIVTTENGIITEFQIRMIAETNETSIEQHESACPMTNVNGWKMHLEIPGEIISSVASELTDFVSILTVCNPQVTIKFCTNCQAFFDETELQREEKEETDYFQQSVTTTLFESESESSFPLFCGNISATFLIGERKLDDMLAGDVVGFCSDPFVFVYSSSDVEEILSSSSKIGKITASSSLSSENTFCIGKSVVQAGIILNSKRSNDWDGTCVSFSSELDSVENNFTEPLNSTQLPSDSFCFPFSESLDEKLQHLTGKFDLEEMNALNVETKISDSSLTPSPSISPTSPSSFDDSSQTKAKLFFFPYVNGINLFQYAARSDPQEAKTSSETFSKGSISSFFSSSFTPLSLVTLLISPILNFTRTSSLCNECGVYVENATIEEVKKFLSNTLLGCHEAFLGMCIPLRQKIFDNTSSKYQQRTSNAKPNKKSAYNQSMFSYSPVSSDVNNKESISRDETILPLKESELEELTMLETNCSETYLSMDGASLPNTSTFLPTSYSANMSSLINQSTQRLSPSPSSSSSFSSSSSINCCVIDQSNGLQDLVLVVNVLIQPNKIETNSSSFTVQSSEKSFSQNSSRHSTTSPFSPFPDFNEYLPTALDLPTPQDAQPTTLRWLLLSTVVPNLFQQCLLSLKNRHPQIFLSDAERTCEEEKKEIVPRFAEALWQIVWKDANDEEVKKRSEDLLNNVMVSLKREEEEEEEEKIFKEYSCGEENEEKEERLFSEDEIEKDNDSQALLLKNSDTTEENSDIVLSTLIALLNQICVNKCNEKLKKQREKEERKEERITAKRLRMAQQFEKKQKKMEEKEEKEKERELRQEMKRKLRREKRQERLRKAKEKKKWNEICPLLLECNKIENVQEEEEEKEKDTNISTSQLNSPLLYYNQKSNSRSYSIEQNSDDEAEEKDERRLIHKQQKQKQLLQLDESKLPQSDLSQKGEAKIMNESDSDSTGALLSDDETNLSDEQESGGIFDDFMPFLRDEQFSGTLPASLLNPLSFQNA
ncbi:uncharacterized protein MONOS_4112 [Monocercomonoides exilis]|uniref:uncharacterized protein n=1 Tax=Monocercomonoides exilis TaxID=2049356 RepID=UPI00355A672D|nr:hypothetical protein MONOS_4112 [Monocercomonoides exilis]|eukprot:MONOS_4112.1-p1 / transcript=MONOS_4112.1 / gene=MONOS_4112 / organism=Monocercomonoides_exilis_PA203 / gene_product=unspecified product / transcript_product=unspecified product / location=Mono_scaffold00105:13394-16576(+) / protein_length=1030 / sequence_SO=supercontig / SO=protein_coding / is_pseudo=false